MEGLIIMIVIALLSRIFGGNKEEKQSKDAMPPFGSPEKPAQKPLQQPQPAKPRVETTGKSFTSLEDFTREIFGELAEKEKEVQKKLAPNMEPLERKVQEPASTVPSFFEPATQPTMPDSSVAPPVSSRVSTRPELGASRPIVQREKLKANDYVQVPTTQQQLVQAIIASEIIGQPKARQSRR